MVTGGWITQADRSRWQQRAAAELAAILAAHPGLPPIAWTVTMAGGSLAGQVLSPAGQRPGVFSAWRLALGLKDGAGLPPQAGAVYLHARAVRNGVPVSVSATVFPDGQDGS